MTFTFFLLYKAPTLIKHDILTFLTLNFRDKRLFRFSGIWVFHYKARNTCDRVLRTIKRLLKLNRLTLRPSELCRTTVLVWQTFLFIFSSPLFFLMFIFICPSSFSLFLLFLSFLCLPQSYACAVVRSCISAEILLIKLRPESLKYAY
jgi:hypothetical protein